MPHWRVVNAGIALKRGHPEGDALISCGLAGGLREDLPTGTVVIAEIVRRPDGTTLKCDGTLVRRLVAGARELRIEPIVAPIVTTETVVVGTERLAWCAKGYVAADMESGLLSAARVASVRVILDTPLRELSPEWLDPSRAFLNPKNWLQAAWLARHGPRCARLAARVIAAAFA